MNISSWWSIWLVFRSVLTICSPWILGRKSILTMKYPNFEYHNVNVVFVGGSTTVGRQLWNILFPFCIQTKAITSCEVYLMMNFLYFLRKENIINSKKTLFLFFTTISANTHRPRPPSLHNSVWKIIGVFAHICYLFSIFC